MISTLQGVSFILVTSVFGISPDFLNITVYYASISTRFCPWFVTDNVLFALYIFYYMPGHLFSLIDLCTGKCLHVVLFSSKYSHEANTSKNLILLKNVLFFILDFQFSGFLDVL
jgi:hypothetical protein